MQESNLLSVIIPVYNDEEHILSCIESVQKQTYKNIEIIIIDDGSNDKSGDICDRCAKTDSRIKVIHIANHGRSNARNTGLDSAKGDLIAFVDSDDLIDYQMYEVLIHSLISTETDIAACSYKKEYSYHDIKIKRHNTIPNPIVIEKRDLYQNITGSQKSIEGFIWNKVWKREIIGNHRFSKRLSMGEDGVFTFQVIKNANKASFVDLQMYHYYLREKTEERNYSLRSYIDVIESHRLMIKETPSYDRVSLQRLSLGYIEWNVIFFNYLNETNQIRKKYLAFITNNLKKHYSEIRKVKIRHLPTALFLSRGGYRTAKTISSMYLIIRRIKNKYSQSRS